MDANWIWIKEKFENQYVEFVKSFDAKEGFAELKISCETEYAAFLNGKLVSFGQYDNYPDEKTYNTDEISLNDGNNELYILAYHQGINSAQYVVGEAGLIFEITSEVGLKIISDSSVLCRNSPFYQSGVMPFLSSQLGICFNKDNSVIEQDDWEQAVIKKIDAKLSQRPVKKLLMGKRISTKIIAQGNFLEYEAPNIAIACQRHYLSHVDCKDFFINYIKGDILNTPVILKNTPNGKYILIDFGQEETGFLDVELNAPLGTVLDIAWGEHLDDLRVRSAPIPRNFVTRYICSEGKNHYLHLLKRIAGRYLQIYIHEPKGDIELLYAGIRPVCYPFNEQGILHILDSLHSQIAEVSKRTLKLCAHEHYEDCPWREQGLYAFDSRNQMLFGYYAFGEYELAKASIDLLGKHMTKDGWIEICAPSKTGLAIPAYSFFWIVQNNEYLMYSGDYEFTNTQLPRIKKMLDVYINSIENGFCKRPKGKEFWNFYEWAEGLAGHLGQISEEEERREDAPFQLFFYLALKNACGIFSELGDVNYVNKLKKIMQIVKKRINEVFWDESMGVFSSYVKNGVRYNYSELVQSLAVYTGICSKERSAKLRQLLLDENNGLIKISLMFNIYKYEALLQEAKYAKQVMEEIAKLWGHMLYNKATSFWETIKGADDFDGGGSLCHACSSTPLYIYYAYILGVKPTKPGFIEYDFKPMNGGISKVEATLFMPKENIYLSSEVNGKIIKKCIN